MAQRARRRGPRRRGGWRAGWAARIPSVPSAGRKRERRTTALAQSHRPRLPRPPLAPPRFLGRAVAIGRRARLPARSRPRPLARCEWLAVGEVAGAASGARILSAAAIDLADIEALFGDRIEAWTRGRASIPPPARSPRARAAASARSARHRARPQPRPGGDRGRPARRGAPPRPGAAAVARQRASRCATAPPSPPRTTPAITDARRRRLIATPRRMARRPCSTASAASTRSTGAARARSTACSATRRARRSTASPRPSSPRPPDRATRSIMPRPAAPTVEVRAQALYGLKDASDGRGRARPADPGHHQPGAPPDPDHARPARFLGRVVARRRQGNARPLPAPPVARRPRRRPADAAHQARELLIWPPRFRHRAAP